MSLQANAQDENKQPVRVAAASDLRFALDDIAATFERESGYRLRITYGSTGNFAHQIRSGAPFHLFLAADERYIDALAADQLTQDAGTLYAIGRLALVVPRVNSPASPPTLTAIHAQLSAHPGQRFAIANPAHAPYGERARDVLKHEGLWDALQPRLVLGENVSQAARFALSGSTVGGLIAWSLALAPPIAERANSALIPSEWHRPLNQRMVLLHGASEGALALYRYLQERPARAVLERYGFSLPTDKA
ncbi:MAG: molybdate ABC transporter substrate-binding protein [Chromatocurvus sp.]